MICSKCGVNVSNNGSLKVHVDSCQLTKDIIVEIREKYLDGMSMVSIRKIFHISKYLLKKILSDILRTRLESSHMAAKNRFGKKHSEETKEKIRQSRLKYMMDHPDKTAWRSSNLSYPEKIFLSKIGELNWGERYLIVREKSFFPYFVDFAFEDQRIAVEIDGSQHELEERKISDQKKDELILSFGWDVIRFTAKKIKDDIDECFKILENHLSDKISLNPGVYKYGEYKKAFSIKKTRIKKIKISRVKKIKISNRSMKEYQSSQRRVDRPPYKDLIVEIEELGYCEVGRKYGVSDNAIRKWIKMYEKYGENF